VTSAVVAAGLATNAARAQSDINPPIPNVMLLIDTSGSMENMPNDKPPEDASNNPPNTVVPAACVPGQPTALNKWATLVSVLSGTIQNFSCEPIDRSSAPFLYEYSYPPNNGPGAVAPYDANYFLLHHRLLSNGCGPAPGSMPPGSVWYGWPPNAIAYHGIAPAKTICNTWTQTADGIIDSFKDQVRFGLATFDTLPDPGTGASGTNVVPSTATAGMWSYFLNWNNGGSPAQGMPPNCSLKPFEVGIRNPAAPPWEGRLLGFGDPNASVSDVINANSRVEQELQALRPYGATPLAGMMKDGYDFLFSDTMIDPSTGKQFGPAGVSGDPYWQGGCRKTFVILLSDGAPNLDLRPVCATGNGVCPYPEQPWQYAHDMAFPPNTNQAVKVFTVSFGLSNAKNNANQAFDCKTLKPADVQGGGLCDTATDLSLQACCNMMRIAVQGHPAYMAPCVDTLTCGAYFADNTASLKSALNAVLTQIATSATSRTMPVNVAAGGVAVGLAGTNNANAVSYQFLAGFTPKVGAALWQGTLIRKRWVCDANLNATVTNVDPSSGDDFAANLNSNAGPARQFFTAIATPDATGAINSTRSIRPAFAAANQDDGLGLYGGAQTTMAGADAFATTVGTQPAALSISNNNATCASLFSTSSATTCAQKVLGWEVGAASITGPATRIPASCPFGMSCSLFGAIYHSTPSISGPPREYVRDESYSMYATTYVTPLQAGHQQKVATRPLTLYTATTDGQLHGFVVGVNEKSYLPNAGPGGPANNEIFSFVPPAVLPNLLSTYNQQAVLLDGPPVIKDVVFQRSKAVALSQASQTAWHTVLVGGSGGSASGGFYYALDITDPKAPQFLWQLSTDLAGNKLFGTAVPQPAIATITLKDASGDPLEVAVAILAGGSAPTNGGPCPRANTNWPNVAVAPRTQVQCWGLPNTIDPARSVTIVNLQTGKVIMSMRGKTFIAGAPVPDGPLFIGSPNNNKIVNFDSPMVGIPVPFPAGTGEVANRAYIGDADGTIWRLDLSSTDPTAWTADLAWDGHALATDTWATGQPIATPPVISVDNTGNAVVLFSTGDQQLFTSAAGVQTRIWSILEKPAGAVFKTTKNWVQDFSLPSVNGGPGARVVGPISLFNSTAYFSVFTPNPPGSPVCDAVNGDGKGYIWAVDYLQDNAAYGGPGAPLERWDLTPATTKPWKGPYPGATAFGLAVTQTPSCVATTTIPDAYMGAHTTVSGASNVSYSLVFQTGAKGGMQQNNAPLLTQTIALAAPKRMTRMDSWASVVE
jgi:type IV pilus assembly protein PilY1